MSTKQEIIDLALRIRRLTDTATNLANRVIVKANTLPDDGPGPPPSTSEEIPHKLVKHHDMPHGDWVPDHAALPEAEPITDFAQMVDGGVYVIPKGTSVVLDGQLDVVPEAVCIKGRLGIHRTADTRMILKTLQTYEGGFFDCGTHDDPVRGRHELIFSGLLNTTRDPEQLELGGLFHGGKVRMHGAFTGTHMTRLVDPVQPDSVGIWVENTIGWRIGDELILTDSRKSIPDTSKGRHEQERVTIVSIVRNEGLIGISPAVKHFHDQYVGHLTRNIQITSPQDPGHVLIGPQCDGIVHSVRITGLGRTTSEPLHDTLRDHMGNLTQTGTNQRARYPLHVHHCSHPFSFDRCVIEPNDASKTALTHHDSHGVESRCILIGLIDGSGIYLEQGTETGECFDNLICSTAYTHKDRTHSFPDYQRFEEDFADDPLGDRGFNGNAIWMAGPFVDVHDNVISGVFLSAIEHNPERLKNVTIKTGPQAGLLHYDLTKIAPTIRNNVIRHSGTGIKLWGIKDTGLSVSLAGNEIYTQNGRNGRAIGLGHMGIKELQVVGGKLEIDPNLTGGVGIGGTTAKLTDLKLKGVEVVGWEPVARTSDVDDKAGFREVFKGD